MKLSKEREGLREARRIVVKVGSRVLVQRNGRPDQRRMSDLVRQIVGLHRDGLEVVLVTSGAVGAGMEALGLASRPDRLPDLQMAASVGQTRLMTTYEKLFSKRRCKTGQVLLTHDDLRHRTRHLNARNTLLNLLRNGIIPIVNENDVVAVEEIKVGDNDVLASLVALLIEADALVLLTTADGLRAPTASGRTRRLSHVEAVTPDITALAGGATGAFSTGGMASKLEAAQTATKVGTAAVIADGRKPDVLKWIFQGADTGTLIGTSSPRSRRALTARKRWIAFFHRAQGSLVIDEGARAAIETKGKSLLPIGIKHVIGDFGLGAVVNVKTPDDQVVARGLVEFTSDEIRRIIGRRTSEIASILGHRDYDEVIHRDNMVNLSN